MTTPPRQPRTASEFQCWTDGLFAVRAILKAQCVAGLASQQLRARLEPYKTIAQLAGLKPRPILSCLMALEALDNGVTLLP